MRPFGGMVLPSPPTHPTTTSRGGVQSTPAEWPRIREASSTTAAAASTGNADASPWICIKCERKNPGSRKRCVKECRAWKGGKREKLRRERSDKGKERTKKHKKRKNTPGKGAGMSCRVTFAVVRTDCFDHCRKVLNEAFPMLPPFFSSLETDRLICLSSSFSRRTAERQRVPKTLIPWYRYSERSNSSACGCHACNWSKAGSCGDKSSRRTCQLQRWTRGGWYSRRFAPTSEAPGDVAYGIDF